VPQKTSIAAELIDDTAILQPSMTFAVDGETLIDGELAGWIGDSIVVTETGCDYLTNYCREIMVPAS
jgi:Xaa-Pro dipeptidase